jgi:hypothetical protein
VSEYTCLVWYTRFRPPGHQRAGGFVEIRMRLNGRSVIDLTHPLHPRMPVSALALLPAGTDT